MFNNKISFFYVHPNDEVLGSGGSIARWSKEGAEFSSVLNEFDYDLLKGPIN